MSQNFVGLIEQEDGKIQEGKIGSLNLGKNESDNLAALRQSYKHRRKQSKHQLLNHYKSLSQVAGDDFSKILDRRTQQQKEDLIKK